MILSFCTFYGHNTIENIRNKKNEINQQTLLTRTSDKIERASLTIKGLSSQIITTSRFRAQASKESMSVRRVTLRNFVENNLKF